MKPETEDSKTLMEQGSDWKQKWARIRKHIPNKYVLTLIVFGFVFLFSSDRGLIHLAKLRHEIRVVEQQRDRYLQDIEKAQHDLEILQNKDSLERFAREQYLMHAPDEDVYLVDDK